MREREQERDAQIYKYVCICKYIHTHIFTFVGLDHSCGCREEDVTRYRFVRVVCVRVCVERESARDE